MTIRKKDFSAGGVVWDPIKHQFLLIHVENLGGARVWTFPKGHPESHESTEQAAVREVLEETGWMCAPRKTITDVHYMYTHDGVTFDKTVRWFLMDPVRKVGDFDPEEVLEIRWATKDETEQLVSYGSDKNLLKETLLLL